jgi:two-component system OmpR family sensor kinase
MARVWSGQVPADPCGDGAHTAALVPGDRLSPQDRTRSGGVVRSVRGRLWRPSRPLTDSAVVVALCAVATALALTPALRNLGPPGATYTVLTVGTAAATAGGAILAEVAGRICDDPRWSWVAASFALYGVVVLPVTALAAGADTPRLLLVRVAAYLTALPLLVVSLHPPRRYGTVLPWGLTVVGAVLAMASVSLSDDVIPTRAVVVVLAAVVLPGWTAVALGYVVEGYRRRSGPRLRLGLGLAVVAGAQLYRGVTGALLTDLAFAALRLVGALVVLVALAQLVSRSLHAVRSQQWAQQEELAVAALHVERAGELAAERDHELRNGLAGLAGITHLLSSGADDDQQRRLKQAVLSELGRLHTILDGGAVAPDPGPREEYAVEPVLAGLVTLRRSAGAPVGLDVEPGAEAELRACGDATVLAQVVTNLLANCDRHAPGAPVTVRAYRSADRVVVEVRDEGPGLRVSLGHDLRERGARDPGGGGSGLGLHISARLVDREGGELDLRTVTEPLGCLATVRLPAAGTQDRPGAGRPGAAPTR